MAEKILKGINFPGLEGTYMIPDGGSAEGAVLYNTSQPLTIAEQAQARANINAVERIQVGAKIINQDNASNEFVIVEVGESNDKGKLGFYYQGDRTTTLTGLADGVDARDAVTVGQLNAAIGDIPSLLTELHNYALSLQQGGDVV